MDERTYQTPGLRWRPRKDGPVPYWLPRPDAVKAGYPSTAIALKAFAHDPAALSQKCCFLQTQMQGWLDGQRAQSDQSRFDGTIGSVLRLYQTHEESPYKQGTLAPGTMRPYGVYLRKLEPHIGHYRIEDVTGLRARGWFRTWSDDGRQLGRAHMSISVLKAALRFAYLDGHEPCKRLLDALRELDLPGMKARDAFVTHTELERLIEQAHIAERPSLALCFALQFETTLRLWDVKGQWYPLSDRRVSAVADGKGKWDGLQWRHLGADGILRYTPSKTEDTTAREVVIDLSLCPMALAEIARVPEANRSGPVIVNERTGMPYRDQAFDEAWKRIRFRAGLPKTLWCRDLRASAVTEARQAGASLEDTSKVAGHARPRTTQVYDRATVEAHRRVAAVRVAQRSVRPSFPGEEVNDGERQ